MTVEVYAPSPEAGRLWARLLDLAEILEEDEGWVLIGGLMVQLLGFEHGGIVRSTVDIDLLGDSRRRPATTERIAEVLLNRGGEMEVPPVSHENLGYRFQLEGDVIEILGTEGVRRDPRTVGKYVALQVPGGTQALRRAEVVQAALDGRPTVAVRRPSLLGAILLKARAVAGKRSAKFDSDRQDLIRLLTFVEDSRALAKSGKLSKAEVGWLRAVAPLLEFGDTRLRGVFSPGEITAAAQVLRLLTRSQ